MNRQYDLVVIGSGSAGSTMAERCRTRGWSVAVIDDQPFGGTCALRGCDPKKVLVSAAQAADWYNRLQEKGIFDRPQRPNWRALMAFKESFTGPVPEATIERFSKKGITSIHGRAHFTGPNTLQVNGDTFQAQHITIASGAKPTPLHIEGEEHIATSTDFLALHDLPPRIVLIGGGYISFEFAHVAARAGADVSIMHRSARPLIRFEADLVDQLVQTTRELGIHLYLDTPVTRVEKTARGYLVHGMAKQPDGRTDHMTVAADLVVHGAGRVPDIEDMNLDAAGIKATKRGIAVNHYMQSVSNPAVYAAGDAADGGLPLTPVASLESSVVADNLLHGNHRQPDYHATPSVVFTIPALAGVGLTEAQARERGIQVDVRQVDMSNWATSRRLGLRHAAAKVLTRKDDGKLVGAHIFGANAEETINIFALALHAKMQTHQLAEVLFAYPTASSDIKYMVR